MFTINVLLILNILYIIASIKVDPINSWLSKFYKESF